MNSCSRNSACAMIWVATPCCWCAKEALVRQLRDYLHQVCHALGLFTRIVLHQFRHTYASEMLRAGVGLPAVMKLLGHTSPEMTMQYLDVTLNDLQRAFKTSPSCSAVEDTDHSPSGPRWSDRFFARCSTCARDVSQDAAKRHFSAPPRPPLQPAHQNRYRSAQPRDALKMGRDWPVKPMIQAKCREGALNRLRRRSFLREPTVRVQVESESVNIEAANEHSQATPALKSVAVERNLPERCASLPPWHGLHKKRESPLEALVSRFAALVVSQTYHNEVVRRDDQSGLAARTRHIERLLGHGILAVAIDPEEAAINRALVSFPGRRRRTDEFDEPLGQDLLPVPDSILKIEIAKAGPVPRRRELVPLRQEISKRVRF